ncbi:PAS domain S-box-containing protein [Tessaracoccus bendigoensis DSM 12906]|uniref:PAS domain S-box-containing protein n=1 Tax=Tessaracoccus bendigoensis DSM 12906 TaxID=1123357 RepID=A0A1M6ERU8_9ACTN|nr:ANTAR domain-containing protein [Tessaracoccus bendigoensis]SHI88242.1 PAS domain S-box-containing protein [Tessaracoccus bendigoensis DSM 12906]
MGVKRQPADQPHETGFGPPPEGDGNGALSYATEAEWRRAILESIRDGIVLCDADGLVLEMNQAFTDLFGYRLEDGPFHPPYPWWPPEEESEARHSAQCFYKEVMAGSTPEKELVFVTRDGASVWVRMRGTPIQHGTLGVTYLCVLRETTREREAQHRREAAASVSRAFVEVGDLAELVGVAEHGFNLLFDGDCTIQLSDGDVNLLLNPREHTSLSELPLTVRIGLAGEPSTDSISLRPGILLAPRLSDARCRAWVQFPRPRRVSVDEMVVADLLAASFASAVARLMTAEEVAERLGNLKAAIESHRLVGQATGVLVERRRILPGAAFELLRAASQRHNVKLRDLAARIVETGLDPDSDLVQGAGSIQERAQEFQGVSQDP